jgi:hypothetical protein
MSLGDPASLRDDPITNGASACTVAADTARRGRIFSRDDPINRLPGALAGHVEIAAGHAVTPNSEYAVIPR